MKKFLFIIVACFSAAPSISYAQRELHRMSAEESTLMPAYLQQARSAGSITTPPASPVRAMAEWEEIDGLLVTWTSYTSTIREIIRHARLETHVYVVCADSNTVKSSLTSNGIPLSNISYLITPFNSVWSRDYGQWNVYTNDIDSLLVVDWIYNRPRPADNVIPQYLANYTNLPFYEMSTPPYDLVHTGGNFMVDGFGTAFSSQLILTENTGKTSAQIDTIMKAFMGIDRYIKMPVLPYDGIHHIDMHMKLLDEETLLVGQYPAGMSDGPQIEANLQWVLANYPSVYGTPYKVIRIPMPPNSSGNYPPNSNYYTYANSVFINKTILIPTYTAQYDTTALRIYREALPGYNVQGINCNSIIAASGALHCITKELGAADPLVISHQSHADTYNSSSPYMVSAMIRHRSGIANATVWFRTDTLQPYTSMSMTLTNAVTHEWSAGIPAQQAGKRVYYYIAANAISGKAQVRPMPAPAGYWQFDVLLNTAIAHTYVIGGLQMQPAFPNPSNGITCIPVESGIALRARLSLIDVTGRIVLTNPEVTIKVGENKLFINTSDVMAGLYSLILEGESGTVVQKLMVR